MYFVYLGIYVHISLHVCFTFFTCMFPWIFPCAHPACLCVFLAACLQPKGCLCLHMCVFCHRGSAFSLQGQDSLSNFYPDWRLILLEAPHTWSDCQLIITCSCLYSMPAFSAVHSAGVGAFNQRALCSNPSTITATRYLQNGTCPLRANAITSCVKLFKERRKEED